MLIVLPNSLTAHTTAEAAKVMGDFNKILEAINGNIDRANLKDLEVIESKLGDGAVSSRKLKPTFGSLACSAAAAINVGGGALIPGLELKVTPAVASLIRLDLTVSLFDVAGAGSGDGSAWVEIDNVPVGPQVYTPNQGGYRVGHATITRPLTAAAHTIKVKAFSTSALCAVPAPTPETNFRDSRLDYFLVAS